MEKEPIQIAADRMKDDKKLPPESKMQKAVEKANAADGIDEAARQAEKQADKR